MRYQQPAGAAEGAPYLDGNPNAGVLGSIVPAKAIEHGMRELVHLITFAGLNPSETDLEQVRKAIAAMIAAATGAGDTSQFITMLQARARLPFMPEVLTADGKINVTSPGAGSILVPPTVAFQHRGIYPVNTSDYDEAARTKPTEPNRIYHLRWKPTNGFGLFNTTDPDYNPGVDPEGHAKFDTTYDDMLVARVVTNNANVATITRLVNLPRLRASQTANLTFPDTPVNGSAAAFEFTLNWSRTPVPIITWERKSFATGGVGNATDWDERMTMTPTRYGVTGEAMLDYADPAITQTIRLSAFD